MILEFEEYLKSRIGSQEQEQNLYTDSFTNNLEQAIIKIDKIIEILEYLEDDLLKSSLSTNIKEKIKFFKDFKKELELEEKNTKQSKT